ncbi:MAG: hypothetical protein HY035_11730 [Nitrospirae bacterium]|nr:hypothetical protein [Nitrospirota bacterium]MBI3379052.1 hypothetical protein [Nitrospirota bacterium]
MNISDYIAELEALINSSQIVSSYNLTIDRKTADIAFVSGKIDFRDGTILDYKEFVEESEGRIEKYKYGYNYRKGSDSIFRYDNAPDPKAKDIKTFPYHKHLKDGTIAESGNVKLSNVISEIEGLFIPNNE